MSIDVHAQVVTCSYCKLSSFVHLPNRQDPQPPPGTQSYGHIHVPNDALKAVGAVVAVSALVPLIFGGVIAVGAVAFVLIAIMAAGGGADPSPVVVSPPPSIVIERPPVKVNVAPSETSAGCELAIKCCKAVIARGNSNADQQRSCEGLRVMPPADCAKQGESFAQAARSMGIDCRK